ncbi:protein SINE1 [Quercus suber]|uniref:protein SINE1 n=1 Tax=Quercus suber TaxID=58331 RepID=UPI000CE27FEC|nr:protein SINE1 [Quercus suber]
MNDKKDPYRSTVGRNLSPKLQRELENLQKDADSRKSAMKALKCYVKDLDSKSIPLFLAQVSETKGTGSLSGECTISLYEVLARVHGVKIVPLIDSIMTCIISTLASSAGSFPLQQACSKVVPAIARYGIDPTTPEDKKRHIIHSLCKPLSNSLLGSQECLTSGAALCLKALVDSDNWRFASDEMVNKVCQNVAAALEEKSTQTNSHMGLVMALAKRNGLIVEAYARLLIRSGLQILNSGVSEGNSQKRLLAIQMVNFLMKNLDSRSIFSELELIIEEMENCKDDKMAYVRGAAYEALQTARKITPTKGSNFESTPGSITGSNFSRREHSRSNLWNAGGRSPSPSPESQTIDSFLGYESWAESPISMRQVSQNSDYDRRSVNRKLWSYENGGVDVSLKDGLFSEVQGSFMSNTHSGNDEYDCNRGDYTEEFAGFCNRNPRNGMSRSATTSPLRSRTQINVDNIRICKTPRKLICSLQDPNNGNSDFSEKQARRFKSLSSNNIEWTPTSKYEQNGFSHVVNYNDKENGGLYATGEQFQGSRESVSSTDDVLTDTDLQASREVVLEFKTRTHRPGIQKAHQKTAMKFICGLFFVLLAVFTTLLGIKDQDEGYYLVPT